MYNDLINIVIVFFMISRLQSYGVILKSVSVSYGKYSSKEKLEIVANQRIIKYRTLLSMENRYWRNKKRGRDKANLRQKVITSCSNKKMCKTH